MSYGDLIQNAASRGVVPLGGIIIEIQGEMALVHHGGYRNADNLWEYRPFTVSWRTDGPNLIFDLRGWACRIMQVIETNRRLDMLKAPIYTTDGELTLDWTADWPEPTRPAIYAA